MIEFIEKFNPEIIGVEIRNEDIDLEIIKKNNGKRMIFLIGADHRDYTIKKLATELGNSILLNHFIKSLDNTMHDRR